MCHSGVTLVNLVWLQSDSGVIMTHQCILRWVRGWRRCRGKRPRRPRPDRASPGRASSPWCVAWELPAWRGGRPTCPSLPGTTVTGWEVGGEPGYIIRISRPAVWGGQWEDRDRRNILTRRLPSTDMMIMEIITMIWTIIIIDINLIWNTLFRHEWWW